MKRWITRILICLLLGAVMNVFVAWSLAYTVNVANGSQTVDFGIDKRSSTTVSRWNAFGSMRWWSSLTQHDLEPSAEAFIRGTDLVPDYWDRMDWPAHQSTDQSQLVEILFVDARGWPLHSLAATGRTVVLPDYEIDVSMTGIEITSQPWTPSGMVTDVRVLPTQPIWLNLYWNTLFYAIVVYILLFGFTDLRRMYRWSRGRCLNCGHHLMSDQMLCPECGWQRCATQPIETDE